MAVRAVEQQSWLPQWWSQSLVIGGFTRLAGLADKGLKTYWQQSLLLAPLRWGFCRNVTVNSFESKLPAGIAIVGLVFTVLLSTFASTGLLGASLLGFTALTLLAAAWKGRERWLLNPTLLDFLIGLYFLWHGVATAFSSWPLESIAGLKKAVVFACGFLLARFAFSLSSNWLSAVTLWMAVLFLAGCFEAGVAWLQVTTGVDPLAMWSDIDTLDELRITRVYGTLQPLNPNLLAGFLLPTLPAGLWLVLSLLPTMQQVKTRWPWAVIILLGCGNILWATVQTGSRGAYISLLLMGLVLIASLMVWLSQALKTKTSWLRAALLSSVPMAGLLAVGGLLLAKPKLLNRLASIGQLAEDSSIAYRFRVYESCGQMISDNPIWGIGPGNSVFKQVYGLYMTPGYNALACYSVPLEAFVELGVIGFGLLGMLNLICFFAVLAVIISDKLPWQGRLLGLPLIMGLVSFWGQGSFDTIWYRPAVQLVFWGWLAAGAAWWQATLRLAAPPSEGAPAG